MDLSRLEGDLNVAGKAEAGAVLTLLDPYTDEVLTDDEGRTTEITLLGADSRVFVKAEQQALQAKVQKSVKRGKAKVNLAQVASDLVHQLALCTTGWNITEGGKPHPCTTAAAEKLYTDNPWIRDQVQEFIVERANFLGEA